MSASELYLAAVRETTPRSRSSRGVQHQGGGQQSAQGFRPDADRSGLGPQRLGDLQLLIRPVGGEGGKEAAAVAVDAEHGARGKSLLQAELACV